MLLAIAASTLLLHDRASPPRATTLAPAAPEIRPARPCTARRGSEPLRPPWTSTLTPEQR